MRESALGDETKVGIVHRALGNAPLDLGHDRRCKRSQYVDIASGPIAWSLVDRAQRAQYMTLFCLERNAGIGSDLRAALSESRLVPGVRQNNRHCRADYILAETRVEGVPAA